MPFGMVSTIRWFLGIDEELELLRTQLSQTNDNSTQEIAALRAELDKSKAECSAQVEQLKEANKQYVLKEENEKLQVGLRQLEENTVNDISALKTQFEQADSRLSSRINITSVQIANLTSIVQPAHIPLLTAPLWNYTKVVATKLKATINRDGRFGTQSMHLAVEKGQPELIELLFKLGIPSGYLDTAYNSGKIEAVVKIIEFEVNKKHPNNYNPLNPNDNQVHRLCRDDHGIKNLEKCEENTILELMDYDYLPPKENSLICYAAKKGFIKVIHEIFKSQSKIDINNALSCAITGMRIDSTAKLLDLASDTNISKFGIAIAYDVHSIRTNECNKVSYYSRLYHAKDDIERALQYAEIKSKGCQHGIGDFLYIAQLLQEAYTEDQTTTMVGLQSDGTAVVENHS